MHTKLMKRAAWAAAGAASLLLAGVAQAALQDRDLNGDKVADAFYDTDLSITWLRNANVNGQMEWDTAVSWADTYSFGGYTDWRLPVAVACSVYNCTGSEMGHLWYLELGNPAGGPMKNTGNFQNLLSDIYWSGTEEVASPSRAWSFDFSDGSQYADPKNNMFFALAVHPGDIGAPVPEPETYALMLAGLAALAVTVRHSHR